MHYFFILGCIAALAKTKAQDVNGSRKQLNPTGLAIPRQDLACNYGYQRYKNKCYYFSCDGCVKDFNEALSYCKSESANLVSIHDVEEDKFLSNRSENFLIGLQYLDEDEAPFRWSDFSEYNYNNLDQADFVKWNEYYGNCARVEGGKWKNAVCDRQYRWICEKEPQALPNTRCPDFREPMVDRGSVYSPGYPAKYYINDEVCEYRLLTKLKNFVKIIFNDTNLYYDLEAPQLIEDRVDVYEGFRDQSVLIASITAVNASGVSVQTRVLNEMKLVFHSKTGHTGTWAANWYTVVDRRAAYKEVYRKVQERKRKEMANRKSYPVTPSRRFQPTNATPKNNETHSANKTEFLQTVSVIEPIYSTISMDTVHSTKNLETTAKPPITKPEVEATVSSIFEKTSNSETITKQSYETNLK